MTSLSPDLSALSLGPDHTPSTYTSATSPALTYQSAQSTSSEGANLKLDLTLGAALNQLVSWLIDPLSQHYDPEVVAVLREVLFTTLEGLYHATWDEANTSAGTGSRSLICTKELGLPKVLRAAAKQAKVDEPVWRRAIGTRTDVVNDMVREDWQAWCDPGVVTVRFGSWDYDDQVYDPVRAFRGTILTIWQARAPLLVPESNTPSRPSHAIAIRAPSVYAIPPTPAAPQTEMDMRPSHRTSAPTLLPAVAIDQMESYMPRLQGPRGPSPISSQISNDDDVENHSRQFSSTSSSSDPPKSHRRSVTGSTSSVASSLSDTNSGLSQLLTPAARSPASDPFTLPDSKSTPNSVSTAGTVRGRTPSPSNTPAPTPTVTPYDGGNVTVLGGGVKLGGGGGGVGGGASSRASSVISSSRTPIDRSRSPSISLASRALNTALGPNANGTGSRKVRTRRRIMPTYLGPNGQPGVGGPFGPFAGKIQPGGQPGMSNQHAFHTMMGMRMGLAPRMT
ncbi:hypothetical protein BCR39DRAFT_545770 [Naematelia encephala]|uniref:Anti-proliferative protein domain-containing protein n=1 Tax=Naematelia encephala TaxID=71784 RepID=A0A1Y2AQF4_9TREE|nr:hypothetical protein BCR39DRAFT_545770 [Naematelia encephala]